MGVALGVTAGDDPAAGLEVATGEAAWVGEGVTVGVDVGVGVGSSRARWAAASFGIGSVGGGDVTST